MPRNRWTIWAGICTDVIPIGTYAKAAPTLQEQVSFFCYLWTGKPWLDESFKPTFNNKEGIEAIEFWHSLKPYVQPGELQYNRGDVRPLFRDGRVAMLMAEAPGLYRCFKRNTARIWTRAQSA